jgi:hypothetical protein
VTAELRCVQGHVSLIKKALSPPVEGTVMSQRPRRTTRARVAAVLAAPVLALTVVAPTASAATATDTPAVPSAVTRAVPAASATPTPAATPAACAGTVHVSLMGHKACLTPTDDDSDSGGPLDGLLGIVTGLLGGLLGGL